MQYLQIRLPRTVATRRADSQTAPQGWSSYSRSTSISSSSTGDAGSQPARTSPTISQLVEARRRDYGVPHLALRGRSSSCPTYCAVASLASSWVGPHDAHPHAGRQRDDIEPGDLAEIPAGHDSWVVGEQAATDLDISAATAAVYARPLGITQRAYGSAGGLCYAGAASSAGVR